jgi:hypothetical protein
MLSIILSAVDRPESLKAVRTKAGDMARPSVLVVLKEEINF